MDGNTLQYYEENAEHLAERYNSADLSALHHFLRRWLPPRGKVLEIGCGTGRDALFMSSLGCDVTALDGSSSMVELTKKAFFDAGVENARFFTSSFPLPSEHFLLKEKFDAIVSIAVLMHISEHELFGFAHQVASLTKEKGLFICSFCSGTRGPSEKRLYVSREPGEVRLLFERLGFQLLDRIETADGLGRDMYWHTLVFTYQGGLSLRPVYKIESIVNRDRKTATYKLALLRALCDIAQMSSHQGKWFPGERVGIPLGLVVERWLYYYWPLVDTEMLFPQIRGGEEKRKMGFRINLERLINVFRPLGGLDGFHNAYRSGILGEKENFFLIETLNALAKAIINGPVHYAGGSLEGNEDFFSFSGKRKIKKLSFSGNFLSEFGMIYVAEDIWREFCLIGHWMGESIIFRWAELVHEISGKNISVPEVLERLLRRPETERDIKAVREIYKGISPLRCVWSNKLLSKDFHVDHVIPFSLWHNNDLWNLLPTDPKVNNQKRDKVISPKLLKASEERIVFYWRKTRERCEKRFLTELQKTLLRETPQENKWEKQALGALEEIVEFVTLQRGLERWEGVVDLRSRINS
ncbi:MAG TPA: methyltransferase domain-containing protein [Synergistaceae bacterium]|nr:methyltransferase domain-containing protein [Synergistaceae bacterium]